jgi:DNA (cytosine-5)-methyltransferase 1
MDSRGQPQAVAQPIGIFQDSEYGVQQYDSAGTLRAGRIPEHQMAIQPPSMAVRRLTPVECERLQGFPDNYTNIPWRKKDDSPDGPRYKALGNSWAVPNVRWIGQRIQENLK